MENLNIKFSIYKNSINILHKNSLTFFSHMKMYWYGCFLFTYAIKLKNKALMFFQSIIMVLNLKITKNKVWIFLNWNAACLMGLDKNAMSITHDKKRKLLIWNAAKVFGQDNRQSIRIR